MIRSIYINNFKSLVDFRLPPSPHALGPFTCLVGLNGAGKSTVLQAFDFLGHLVNGRVADWLKQREWDKADLTSRFLKRQQLINFELSLDVDGLGRIEWQGAFNVPLLRCTAESVRVNQSDVLRIDEQRLVVAGPAGEKQFDYALSGLQYQGSTLSLLKPEILHEGLHALKELAGNLRSLDMLSPHSMRRRAKDADDIGYGGERLSAYLHALPKAAKDEIAATLRDFYPQVQDWTTTALRAGWKDLRVTEVYRDANQRPLDTRARQINDGMLRVLAVLSQIAMSESAHFSLPTGAVRTSLRQKSCVLFDEIENGINPELMQKLVALMLKASRQIIVTTHSPLILNYLPDDVAREAVLLLFRNSQGHTKVVRLFDLPTPSHKLTLLGPGEVFVDTNLVDLPFEAALVGAGGA